MKAIARRLCRLEFRRREEALALGPDGEARRLLEERLEKMSRWIQGERDRGKFVEPNLTFEEVREMVHSHLEKNRIQREENEKRIAARRFTGRYSAYRL